MFEAKLTIEVHCPALDKLAAAIQDGGFQMTRNQTAAPVPAPAPTPTPASAAAPSVPVTTAPAYTLDQISSAGAVLVDAGKMDALMELLGRYGVQAVTQLAPEHYGAFVTELRTLGAQI